MIASSTQKRLADSKVVIHDPTRAEVDVSFGLRMRHARRLVALMVAMFRRRLSCPCASFPCLRIVKVFHLGTALVVERI